MSDWHWYSVPRPSSDDLQTYLEHLKAFNVVWRPARTVSAWYESDPDTGRLMKSIGSVLYKPQTGRITVMPYVGAILREQFVLAQSGQEAFEHTPRGSRGWVYARTKGGYWRTNIACAADTEGDPVAAAVARAEHRAMEIDRVHLRMADEMAAGGV